MGTNKTSTSLAWTFNKLCNFQYTWQGSIHVSQYKCSPQRNNTAVKVSPAISQLQTRSNKIQMIHAANSERFDQEILDQLDRMAPAVSCIVELTKDKIHGAVQVLVLLISKPTCKLLRKPLAVVVL